MFPLLDKNKLRILHFSFLRSIIIFGIEIRGGIYNTRLFKLKTTVNKIIKYILRLLSFCGTLLTYDIFNVFHFD